MKKFMKLCLVTLISFFMVSAFAENNAQATSTQDENVLIAIPFESLNENGECSLEEEQTTISSSPAPSYSTIKFLNLQS